MSHPRKWFATAAACVLAVTAAVGRRSCDDRLGIDLRPLNCRARYAHDRCEPPMNRKLRFLVRVPAEASLEVRVDATAVPPGVETISSEERVLVVELPPGARTLRVSRSDHAGRADGALDIRERDEPQWLRRARELLYSDNAPKARELLEPLEAKFAQLDPLDAAQAMSILAQCWYETGEVKRATDGFSRARDLDTRAGLFGGDKAGFLHDTVSLTRLWAQQERRYEDAMAELERLDEYFQREPQEQVWQLMQEGDLAWKLGDPDEGLLRIERSSQLARRLGDRQALGQSIIMRSNILFAAGLRAAAAEELGIIEDELEPCRDANRAEKLAAIAVDVRADPSAAPFGADAKLDWRRWATEAVRLRTRGQGGCGHDKDWAINELLLGRALAIAGELDAAEEQRAAAKRFPEPTLRMHIDEQDLHGEVLIRGERYREAAALYRQLRTEIVASPERQLSFDVSDALWRADAGLARAARFFDEEEALRAGCEAESDLNHRAGLLPFTSRVGFLARHWQSTALYLSLLAGRDRWDELIDVIRRARLRALLESGQFGRAGARSVGDRAEIERQAERYHVERMMLEQAQVALSGGAQSMQEEHRRELRRLGERTLNHALAIALAAAGLDGGGELPPALPDEALMACAPVESGWICAARLGNQPGLGVVTEETNVRSGREAIERTVIEPLSPVLRRARKIRVFTLGDTSRTDFGGLRLDGTPLDSDREVLYGLDVASPADSGPGRGRPIAQLVVAPSQGLRANRAIAERVRGVAEILAQKYEVRHHQPPQLASSGAPQSSGQLAREFAGADLIVILSDSIAEGPDAPWQRYLKTEVERGFTLGDVLMLPRSSRRVMAFGCGLGISSAARAEAIGVAQAFVLRGARWVVSSVLERVDPDVAANLMVVMSRELIARGDESPYSAARALARARQELRDQSAASTRDGGLVESNLASFKVFAP